MLGSGELGKEVVIELMRLGAEVIACDRYENAPAMQVAHRAHVFDMLDRAALRRVIEEEKPDLIVPEIEAIATPELEALEAEGWTVIPTAEATRLTMDREGIRRLAAEELGVPTAGYRFAESPDEFRAAAEEIGYPVVIKPIMSSSGKGQAVAHGPDELDQAWQASQSGGRTGAGRVIVEEYIRFTGEITLLTVRATNGTLFCDPVGHRQVGGDYVESWQPHPMSDRQLAAAQEMAKKVTDRLGGLGVFGVELFLLEDDKVLFSEISPRPHDTGMVTMATQQWSEFALHARAILGLPIQRVHRHSVGASVAVRSASEIEHPAIAGVDRVFAEPDVDIRVFGKPSARVKRRMAVILATGENWEQALSRGRAAAAKVEVVDAG
jgi:phosphoribosylglycinamide formyltransferase 2